MHQKLTALSESSSRNKILLSFSYGALSSLSMAPTYLVFVLFFTIPLFLMLLERVTTLKQALTISFAWSMGYFSLSLYWISFALSVDIEKHWWLFPFAILGIPFILSLFYTLAGGAYYTLNKKTQRALHHRTILKALSFSCCFCLFDLIRGYAFTGFPWNMLGYSWGFSLSMMQNVSLWGIWGLTFLTWFTCALCTNKKGAIYASLIIIALYTFGNNRINNLDNNKTTSASKVALIQPNIKQKDKWDKTKQLENFELLMSLSQTAANNNTEAEELIIIWPETALTYPPKSNPNIVQKINDFVQKNNIHLITGGIDFEKKNNQTNFYNSIFFISKNGWERYDKKHLVPFGEYVPFSKYFKFIPITQQGFTAGQSRGSVSPPSHDLKISPLICYEAIFSGRVKKQNEHTDLLLNLTNDSWYGHSIGPYQHHDIVKSRAIEEGIPLIRVANTGISSIINSLGSAVNQEKYGQKAIIQGKLPKPLQNATVYAKYSHTILWCLGVFFLITPLFFAVWFDKDEKQ